MYLVDKRVVAAQGTIVVHSWTALYQVSLVCQVELSLYCS